MTVKCAVSLFHGTVGWSAVCYCGFPGHNHLPYVVSLFAAWIMRLVMFISSHGIIMLIFFKFCYFSAITDVMMLYIVSIPYQWGVYREY